MREMAVALCLQCGEGGLLRPLLNKREIGQRWPQPQSCLKCQVACVRAAAAAAIRRDMQCTHAARTVEPRQKTSIQLLLSVARLAPDGCFRSAIPLCLPPKRETIRTHVKLVLDRLRLIWSFQRVPTLQICSFTLAGRQRSGLDSSSDSPPLWPSLCVALNSTTRKRPRPSFDIRCALDWPTSNRRAKGGNAKRSFPTYIWILSKCPTADFGLTVMALPNCVPFA